MSIQSSITQPKTQTDNLKLRPEVCALLDQTLVWIDQKTYDYFVAVLDQPPGGEGFERLMSARKPWRN